MSKLEFLLAFVAIMIALGVTDLLYSLHRLIRRREQIIWHWLAMAWAVHVLLLLVNSWYGVTASLEHPIVDTSLGFVISQLPVLVLLLMALAILPDSSAKQELDLKEWYFSQRRYFFVLHSLFGVSLVVLGLAMGGQLVGVLPFGLLAVLLLTLAFAKNYIYHVVITILILLSDLFFLSNQSISLN